MSTKPLFSVIVPIYNVEGLIRDCINSILNQNCDDYEIIAVEDCSTDSSRRIINELAEKHDFRVVELEENGGLANARNVGLKYATGEYVLFIDSDDEIEPGLLSTLKKISNNSDVVIFNHYREWVSGRRRQNMMTPLLEEMEKSPILKGDIQRKISIFSNLNVAWNKIYKRSFLIDNNLKFDDGYYEDITFNYKVITLSDQISVTPYLGYKYRQRVGSILNSRSDKHKDLTLQYDRLYGFLNEFQLDDFYKKTDEVFVNHLFNLLLKQNYRLSPLAEKSLISETQRLLEEYSINKRYKPKSKLSQLKHLYLKYTKPSVNKALGMTFKLVPRGRFKSKLLRAKTYVSMRVKYLLYKMLFTKLPIKSDTAVFESYWGKSYSCNPKAISEYLDDNAGHKIDKVWFGKAEKMDVGNNKYVEINSLRYFYYLATAKYFVSNANFPNFFQNRAGTIHVQTKHGTPLKKMGCDELRTKRRTQGYFDALAKRCNRWDYVISSNAYSTEVWRNSFPYGYKTLETGYPRNDFIVNNADNEDYKNQVKKDLLIDAADNRKIVIFMPTFREYHKAPEYYVDLENFANNFSDDYIIIARAHYFKSANSNLESLDNVIDASNYPRIEDLYLIGDIMITDYSSSMFDYATLSKPIVLYVPDFEEYAEKRGMNFDIRQEPPGQVVGTEEQLYQVFGDKSFEDELSQAQLKAFHKKFCDFDKGDATQKVCDEVFKY
ncbi:glycosyltransferase [Vibrio toranzoniae]|uniref:bifunctional glycosyltransferase/CDP-glycerol:glycerophosphate glycerophosphotransferase n=1 Tax=Vibrio toranzoniae TaxID=1194427 RepID=UPI0013789F85|nr:bifunctional glycosyltransferase/CDP-glycerol:glycerophosphate glycerophosphotransferase [Vibrio toranzoniae]NAZ54544.1 glycosyltransferase [Vibrio toranzoniae]